MHERAEVPTRNDVSEVSSHLTQDAAAIARVAARICGGAECDLFPLESEAIGDTTRRTEHLVNSC